MNCPTRAADGGQGTGIPSRLFTSLAEYPFTLQSRALDKTSETSVKTVASIHSTHQTLPTLASHARQGTGPRIHRQNSTASRFSDESAPAWLKLRGRKTRGINPQQEQCYHQPRDESQSTSASKPRLTRHVRACAGVARPREVLQVQLRRGGPNNGAANGPRRVRWAARAWLRREMCA